jgi:hypothetical protein
LGKAVGENPDEILRTGQTYRDAAREKVSG